MTEHTFKGLATDTNTTSLMAKLTIYGYQPNKLPSNYRAIYFMDTFEGTTHSANNVASNLMCNQTNILFTSNKSNEFHLSVNFVEFMCLITLLAGVLFWLKINHFVPVSRALPPSTLPPNPPYPLPSLLTSSHTHTYTHTPLTYLKPNIFRCQFIPALAVYEVLLKP